MAWHYRFTKMSRLSWKLLAPACRLCMSEDMAIIWFNHSDLRCSCTLCPEWCGWIQGEWDQRCVLSQMGVRNEPVGSRKGDGCVRWRVDCWRYMSFHQAIWSQDLNGRGFAATFQCAGAWDWLECMFPGGGQRLYYKSQLHAATLRYASYGRPKLYSMRHMKRIPPHAHTVYK